MKTVCFCWWTTARGSAPFVQQDSGGSAGLGLAIVDQIVRSHAGRWTIGDAPLGGCRIAVWLPA